METTKIDLGDNNINNTDISTSISSDNNIGSIINNDRSSIDNNSGGDSDKGSIIEDMNNELNIKGDSSLLNIISDNEKVVANYKKTLDPKDAVLSPLIMIADSNRTLKIISFISLSISILLIISLLVVLGYKDGQIVLLDSMGRPYLSQNNIKDDEIYAAEVQHYISTVVPKILSVSYTTFMDQKYISEYFQSISPYFDNSYKETFKDVFLNSKYVQTIKANNQIIKVWIDTIWDLQDHPQKKDMKKAIGYAKLHILQAENVPPVVINRMYEMILIKKERNIFNQYGLYIVLFTEK